MKIVIDARFWGPRHTGLGIYTSNLVNNLLKIDQINNYIILLPPGEFLETKIPNVKVLNIDIPAYSLKEQLVLPWILYQLNPDIVHFPSINVPLLYFKNYIVTVHDLIKHHFKGSNTTTRQPWLYWLKYGGYLLVFYWVTLMAKKIIIPSQTIKKELNDCYPNTTSKTFVTYEAPTFSVVGKPSSNKSEKYALYVGNAYPHKNLEFLVSGWKEIYHQTQMKLKIVSPRSIFTDKLKQIIAREKATSYVAIENFAAELDLLAIFNKANFYVFPSLMEGFGLPGLDAMLVGIPLICSDIPVLKEIYQGAAVYFNPHDKTDFVNKVVELINNPSLQAELVKKGRQQVKNYSWRNLARQTLEIYRGEVYESSTRI